MLDQTDIGILEVLQKNARITNKELARRVDLAESSCLERVRRLEERGVVTGTHAEVSIEAMGIQLEALLLVRLRKHSRDVVHAFRRHVLALPEVRSLFLVSGQHDFLIHVAVPGADYLREFALDHVTVRPEVTHLETLLVFECVRRHVLPNFAPVRER